MNPETCSPLCCVQVGMAFRSFLFYFIYLFIVIYLWGEWVLVCEAEETRRWFLWRLVVCASRILSHRCNSGCWRIDMQCSICGQPGFGGICVWLCPFWNGLFSRCNALKIGITNNNKNNWVGYCLSENVVATKQIVVDVACLERSEPKRKDLREVGTWIFLCSFTWLRSGHLS